MMAVKAFTWMIGGAALALWASCATAAVTEVQPVLIVNGAGISNYEVEQRMAFLTLLGQKGDLRGLALEALVADRLQSQAAARLDLSVGPEEIQAGMTEFAARAKLPLDAFLNELGKGGVDAETFRDFVTSGLLWRRAAQAKFAGRVEVSEAEIDRAIGQGAAAGAGRRLLLSELIIPADPQRDVAALAGRVRMAIHNAQDFALMARQFSKAATASQGGALNWLDESLLPPDVAGAIAALKPGEMTGVLPGGQGGVAIYFLREEGAAAGKPGEGSNVVDYALLPRGAATSIAATATSCGDFYPAGRKVGGLVRQTQSEGSLPGELRGAIGAMDAGEARVLGDGRIVMLCSRVPTSGLAAAREAIRSELVNRKAGLLSEAWLEELRFDAFIETP